MYLFLFIYLVELKNIHEKHSLKEHRCIFKIHKMTYSNLQSRKTYEDSKNKPLLYPKRKQNTIS